MINEQISSEKKKNSLPYILLLGASSATYLTANHLLTDIYGSHPNYYWTYGYLTLHYGLEPSKEVLIAHIAMLTSALISLSFLMPHRSINEKSEKEKYGSAKFATSRQIRKMGLTKKEGIILGKSRSFLSNQLYSYHEPLSTFIIAPAGAGKTRSAAVPSVLSLNQESLLIHDTKGEIAGFTAKYREQFSKIIMFSPAEKGSAVFNPLCSTLLPKDPDRLHSYCENIGMILFATSLKDDKDSFWAKQAIGIFMFFCLYLIHINGSTSLASIFEATKPTTKNINLKELVENILFEIKSPEKTTCSNNLDLWNEIPKEIKKNNNKSQKKQYIRAGLPKKVIEYGREILEMTAGDKQTAGVLSTFNNHLRTYTDEILRKNMSGQNEIPINDIKNNLYTIYVIIKDEDRKRLTAVASLFFEIIAKKLISIDVGAEHLKTNNKPTNLLTNTKDKIKKLITPKATHGKRYVTFILDEFTRLRGIETLKTLPEISRGYGIGVIYIAQDINQVERTMGKGIAQELNTNCAYKVIFGQNELHTAEKIARSIGNITTLRESKSESDHNDSHSKSLEGINLISAQDILNLKNDNIYIIKQGYLKKPIYAKAASMYSTQPFKNIIKKYQCKYTDYLTGDNYD